MSQITEYFVRHYSLVINNDQESYNGARSIVRDVTRSSGVTVSEYQAMTDDERHSRFAQVIGEEILTMIRESVENVTDKASGTFGAMIITEAMNLDGGDMEWALGAGFLPEDNEADEFFDEDDADGGE